MTSLASELDSSVLNMPDPAGPPASAPKLGTQDGAPAKPAVVLPSKQEISGSARRERAPSKPKYEPKQWQGVSNSIHADDEVAMAAGSPVDARQPNAVPAPAPARNGVTLPSAREIGLVSKKAATTPQYSAKEWTGISNSTWDDSHGYGIPSPENVRRSNKGKEAKEVKATEAGSPQASVHSSAHIPSSREIGPLRASSGAPVGRRHSVPAVSSTWLGVSNLSENFTDLSMQKSSPSPPPRRAVASQESTEPSANSPSAFSIPSTAELNLGPSSYRPRARSRAISHESYASPSSASWSGVSAVLID